MSPDRQSEISLNDTRFTSQAVNSPGAEWCHLNISNITFVLLQASLPLTEGKSKAARVLDSHPCWFEMQGMKKHFSAFKSRCY